MTPAEIRSMRLLLDHVATRADQLGAALWDMAVHAQTLDAHLHPRQEPRP